ncbi:hypothetical protein HOT49_gp308 [Erwinia phage vB_EamM_Alexandra]|uniref:Uncharacterized protein n=1 Tax=Erwinia phage vB_EamM_Alexandra TaxID=2201424 RepID=A0A2Z4QEB7_9CAUD|nr:hypothetical protein HOT49_gp308 [Erwinia phage vB_EamM_Alexandra]AWY08620.1 hypothetical protein Alexandra_311 [Erwinia phage vB_EamM_Alexandra]
MAKRSHKCCSSLCLTLKSLSRTKNCLKLNAARVASVIPHRHVANVFLILFCAYYAVGVIVLIRDLNNFSEDSEMVKRFTEELKCKSDIALAWDALKASLFLVFIHIPCWILRV